MKIPRRPITVILIATLTALCVPFPEKVDVPSSKALATFPAAFAVRRGDMDFVNYLNSWIEARTVNKWLERRRNYWFASMDWADRL